MKKQLKRPPKEDKKPISKKKIIVGVFLILFAFFGSFLIYFIMQVALSTQYPMVVVVSGSMTPNINKGDLLFLCGTDADNIKSGTIADMDGDVIVYDSRFSGSYNLADPIVHRVVGKYQENGKWYFITKGDANGYLDPAPVPEDHVLGVVCGRVPYIGWVKIFLTTTNIFIPLLVILAALLIISIVWDIIKGEEEEEPTSPKSRKLRKQLNPRTEPEEFVETTEIIDKKSDKTDKKQKIRSSPKESSETDDFDF